jgi:HK97 family phage prohead protease
MDGTSELERRLISEAPGLEVKEGQNGRTVIRGYAAVFESPSQDLGGFIEVVERGAFDDVMGANPDVFGKYNHERVIGRTSSGTMRLMVDERGLRYEIDPPKAAADVVELIERGDVRGSSFAFRVQGADESWSKDSEGRMIRRIKRFSFLGDAGPVDQPAYLATETYVSKRAIEIARREQLANLPTAECLEARGAAGSLAVGDFVSWEFSNGKSQGKVTRIVTDGKITVPDSSFTVNGTPDDPAVLIRVYDEVRDGWQQTDRLVGHRATTLTKIDPLPEPTAEDDAERAVSMKPTSGMASAARRGLRLHEQGKSGDGLKPETVARANRLARRENMNEDWIREMNAWFARHAVDRKPGWDTPGDESPGFVAHLLWGGNSAKNWSARKVKELDGERDLPDYDEENDVDEPRATPKASSTDTADWKAKIAKLKATELRTHLHGE